LCFLLSFCSPSSFAVVVVAAAAAAIILVVSSFLRSFECWVSMYNAWNRQHTHVHTRTRPVLLRPLGDRARRSVIGWSSVSVTSYLILNPQSSIVMAVRTVEVLAGTGRLPPRGLASRATYALTLVLSLTRELEPVELLDRGGAKYNTNAFARKRARDR
jgi:hypothetical protein